MRPKSTVQESCGNYSGSFDFEGEIEKQRIQCQRKKRAYQYK